MSTLSEAISLIAKSTENTGIVVNIEGEEIQIYWHGVTQLNCTPAVAAKAIPMLKQLENFGMQDC